MTIGSFSFSAFLGVLCVLCGCLFPFHPAQSLSQFVVKSQFASAANIGRMQRRVGMKESVSFNQCGISLTDPTSTPAPSLNGAGTTGTVHPR
jgi:hypothetical protein